jgi:SAM-dependent methyltransferase
MSIPAYVERAFDPNLAVSMTVHPSDAMFKAGREAHYQSAGRDAVQKIASILFAQGESEPKRILDFGCGFGRVMRYVRATFPESTIYGADTMQPAVDFCAATFRCQPIQSSRSIAQLRLPSDLDVIWAGSVATHLAETDTRNLIGQFASCIRPGGVAIFTTHGRYAASAYAGANGFTTCLNRAFAKPMSTFSMTATVTWITKARGATGFHSRRGAGSRARRRATPISGRSPSSSAAGMALRRAPPFFDGVEALLPPKSR